MARLEAGTNEFNDFENEKFDSERRTQEYYAQKKHESLMKLRDSFARQEAAKEKSRRAEGAAVGGTGAVALTQTPKARSTL